MIVSTIVTVTLRCPSCGKMDFQALSLFSFARKKTIKISCSCGTGLISVGTKDRKNFWLQVDCIMCETKHLFNLKLKQIWSDHVYTVKCDETDVEIGFIGPRDKVRECLKSQDKSLREMAEDLGYVDYFENPEVMYEILDYLYKIVEEGQLYCQCGNYHIAVEIFPDRLELKCDQCNSQGIIYAETDADLETINNSQEIRLTGDGFEIKNGTKSRRRRRTTKHKGQ